MPEFPTVISSFCGDLHCIGVAANNDGGFDLRNTSEADGPVVSCTAAEWEAFVLGVKDGQFDSERLRSAFQPA